MTVVGQQLPFPGHRKPRDAGFLIGNYRPNSDIRHNEKRPRRAASVDTLLTDYAAFFRLAIPINPSRPEQNNNSGAGIGIGENCISNEKFEEPLVTVGCTPLKAKTLLWALATRL